MFIHQRIEEETTEGRTSDNNNIADGNDDDDDDEIEEELEGANESLNLHDVSALKRLPQLTSTPDGKRREVESPVSNSQNIVETTDPRTNTSVSRNEKNQSDSAANPDQKRVKSEKNKGSSVNADGHEKKVHQRSKQHRDVPENPAEDLVVLSFSSSAGEHDFVD